MNTNKKLLTISHLKKYFPIAKSSIFQRERLYVKANEDISLEINEGETIGLVGESGCGKSTLGRVILQLYEQTAGTTMYYGRKLDEVAPSYVKDTLMNLDKYLDRYNKVKAKADNIRAKVNEIGEENADFFLLQDKSLAISDEKTLFSHIVKIVGGFFACKDKAVRNQGLSHMLKIYEKNAEIYRLKQAMNKETSLLEVLETAEKPNKGKINSTKARIDSIGKTLDNDRVVVKQLNDELVEIKKPLLEDPTFAEYEKLLDDGIDLARLKYDEIRLLRKDLQVIYQDPYSSLDPRMTIGQIIEEGLVTHNFFRHGSKAMKEYILKIMRDCGLQDYIIHRYPHQFSGGQRQRVCIARALAVRPKFVVCDECVSALDVSIQSQIINLLDELKEKDNLTYLFISHDLSVVKYISDKIGVMYLGNLVEFADKNSIFDDPRHPYTVSLLSSIPTTDVDSRDKERIILEGNIPSPIRPPQGCKFHTRCFMACDKCKRVPPELVEVEKGHFVACHFPERKIDKKGNYLFELPKTESMRIGNDNSPDVEKEKVEESPKIAPKVKNPPKKTAKKE